MSEPSEVNADDLEWNRRYRKRLQIVRRVKLTPEYILYSRRSHITRIESPRPDCRQVSKRAWESMMQLWRDRLRQWFITAYGPDAGDDDGDELVSRARAALGTLVSAWPQVEVTYRLVR
jgi:hypothetical protein